MRRIEFVFDESGLVGRNIQSIVGVMIFIMLCQTHLFVAHVVQSMHRLCDMVVTGCLHEEKREEKRGSGEKLRQRKWAVNHRYDDHMHVSHSETRENSGCDHLI